MKRFLPCIQAIGFLLALLFLLEGTLRLGGWIYLWRSQGRDAAALLEKPGAPVVLTLGESTTADAVGVGPNDSWPRQLQVVLRRQGLDVAIVNGAVPGTSTPFLLARADELFDRYKPSLVITMMGTNDSDSVRYTEASWRQWRLYKLWAWARERVRWIGRPPPLSRRTVVEEDFGPIRAESARILKEQGPEQVAAYYAKELPGDPEAQALLLVEISHQATAADALRLTQLAFKVFPANQTVVNNALHLHTYPDRSHCEGLAKEVVRRRYELDERAMGIVIHCLEKDPLLADYLADQPVRVARTDGERLSPTGHHYRLLWEKLRQRGIPLIAMQYPTLNVEELKVHFSALPEEEKRGLFFVSNEASFQTALRKWPYEKIFLDRFAVNWGHTTAFGHRMIVDNLVPVVKEVLASKVEIATDPSPVMAPAKKIAR